MMSSPSGTFLTSVFLFFVFCFLFFVFCFLFFVFCFLFFVFCFLFLPLTGSYGKKTQERIASENRYINSDEESMRPAQEREGLWPITMRKEKEGDVG